MHDRLRRLRELLPKAEAHAAETKESATQADQTVRDIKREIAKETGRRRHLRGLAALPAGGSAATTAKQWAAAHPGPASIAGGIAAVTAAGVIGATIIGGGDHNPNTFAAPRPPAVAPPGVHASPRPGPPRPRIPSTPAEPRPPAGRRLPASGIAIPVPPRLRPHLPLPRTQVPPRPGLPVDPGTPPAPPSDATSCRINLPIVLRRGILCGRLFE